MINVLCSGIIFKPYAFGMVFMPQSTINLLSSGVIFKEQTTLTIFSWDMILKSKTTKYTY